MGTRAGEENEIGSYLSHYAAVPSCLAAPWRTQIGLAIRGGQGGTKHAKKLQSRGQGCENRKRIDDLFGHGGCTLCKGSQRVRPRGQHARREASRSTMLSKICRLLMTRKPVNKFYVNGCLLLVFSYNVPVLCFRGVACGVHMSPDDWRHVLTTLAGRPRPPDATY